MRGREAHEPAHVAVVRVAAARLELLRGPGLARHRHAAQARAAAGAALHVHDAGHHVDHRRRRRLRHRTASLAERQRLPWAVGRAARADEARRHPDAAVAERRDRRGELHGRDRDALAVGGGGGVDRPPARHVAQQAARLVGEAAAGAGAEAEATQRVVVAARAHPLADHHRAHVARHAQDAGHVEHRLGVQVADRLARHAQPAAQVEHLVAAHHARLERRRDHEGLERRARLDRVGEGARARVGEGDRAEAVGVEARALGERQHVAGARLDRDHEAALGARLLDALGERGLGGGLQVEVERERHVAAGRGVGVEPRAEQQPAARIALDGQPLRPPQQPLVLHLLDAPHSLAVDVGESHQVCRQRPVRVGAPRLRHRADARQLERPDPLRVLLLDPALHEHEGAALAQPLAEPGRVEVEQGGQLARGGVGVGDLRGHRVDGGDAHGERQVGAAAVDDPAPLGRQLERAQQLAAAARGAARLEQRELRGAHHEAHEGQQQKRVGDPQPQAQRREVRGSHGTGSGHGRGASRSIRQPGGASPSSAASASSRRGSRR